MTSVVDLFIHNEKMPSQELLSKAPTHNPPGNPNHGSPFFPRYWVELAVIMICKD